MKKIYYLPMALLAISATFANAQEASKGLDISNLDTSVNPGTSFYQYATGGWQQAHPLSDVHSRFGTFDQLAENNEKQIKNLLLDLVKTTHPEGSLEQKVGDMYLVGMDSVRLNKDGAAPIQNILNTIQAANSTDDIIRLAGSIRAYANDPFFSVSVDIDDKNSAANIVHLTQGGLGMGDRDYYVNTDTRKMRDAYMTLMTTQFTNAGYPELLARKAAMNVMDVETTLAKAHFTKEAARVPETNYHKMKVSELDSKVAQFDWHEFFGACGLKDFDQINVAQVEPITAAVKVIKTTPIDELKDYLSWCVINSAANYLSDDFVAADFEFFGRQMQGVKVPQLRWRRVVKTISGGSDNRGLGEAIGQMYVAKYFPPQSKERMLQLVHNLQKSLSERIDGLNWMSKATKAKAHEKLKAYIIKIGYPDKWKDYSSLTINKSDSYWDNVMRMTEYEYNRTLNKLGKPADKMEWGMSPQTVNAYYNPTTNEICFPAGILQAPFFYPNADDATNYGAIGVVIGHEMSHGFDDQGRKYDKDGNMTDWWTSADAAKFEEKAKGLADHFSSILVLDTLHGNGRFTLGENIADHGGLQISFNAFSKTKEFKAGTKMDGFTPQQRFFLAYANVWASNIRDAEIIRRTKTDPHSLGRWRVDGALPEIDSWYKAFDIKPTDKLYIPKDKRVSIW